MQNQRWRAGATVNGRPALILLAALWLTGARASVPIAAGADEATGNWPQWRGPFGNGVAPTADPPVKWSETENVRWKVKIPGEGSATPLVWGDQVFIQTAINSGKTGPRPESALAGGRLPGADRGPLGGSGGGGPGGGPGGGFGRGPGAGGGGRGGPGGPGGRPGGFGGGPRGGGPGGFSGPAPTQVYQFVLMCLDRRTGNVLWQQVAREEVPHGGYYGKEGSFASPSPVTDGKHVWAFFGSQGLHCYDMEGNQQWSHDFGKLQTYLYLGEGSSPALYGDALIVNWDDEASSFITALDKSSGKELWKTARDERTSWATPLVVEHDGKPQVVTAASGKVRGYDLADGKLLWECGGLTANVIASPVAGDGLVYATSGYRGYALLAIRLGRTGNLTGSDAIAWSARSRTSYVPSPLLYEGRLYVLADSSETLSCYDAKTGRKLIDGERIEGLEGVYASPVGAGGRVYVVGRNGATVVLKASDKLEVLATNHLDERIDASPVSVGKDLLLRGHEYLYCIEGR